MYFWWGESTNANLTEPGLLGVLIYRRGHVAEGKNETDARFIFSRVSTGCGPTSGTGWLLTITLKVGRPPCPRYSDHTDIDTK